MVSGQQVPLNGVRSATGALKEFGAIVEFTLWMQLLMAANFYYYIIVIFFCIQNFSFY